MSDNMSSNSIRHRIRVAVEETHGVLDKFVASQQPFSTVEDYEAFLWRMRQLYVAMQPAIRKVSGQIGLPDCSRECIEAATRDCPNMMPPATAPELTFFENGAWGYAYVMEGSALGATQLVKLARQRLPAECSVEFLATVSAHAKSRWPIFIKELDSSCEDVDVAISAAKEAFSYALEIFSVPIEEQ